MLPVLAIYVFALKTAFFGAKVGRFFTKSIFDICRDCAKGVSIILCFSISGGFY
jgi:hypothetical protein